MKPTALTLVNVKNRDGHHVISSVNAITGSNFSGKTALLSAAKIVLLGYEPKLGKQHQATIQLAAESRPEMSVSMVMDNKDSFSRTWKRGKDGAIKYSETGTPPEVPAILMDMSGYFGLKTEQDRVNYVFDRINPSELNFNDKDLMDQLGKIEALPIEPALKARGELLEYTTKVIGIRDRDKQTIQDFVAAFIEDLKGQKKEADGNHKALGQAMQPLKWSGPIPPDKSKELEAKRQELASADKEREGLQSQKDKWDADSKRVAEIKANLEKPLVDTSEKEKELAALQVKIGAYKSETTVIQKKLTTLRERSKQVTAQRKELEDQLVRHVQFMDDNKCVPTCPFGQKAEADRSGMENRLVALKSEEAKIIKDGTAQKKALEKSQQDDDDNDGLLLRAGELKTWIEYNKSIDAGMRDYMAANVKEFEAKPAFEESTLTTCKAKIALLKEQITLLDGEHQKFTKYTQQGEQLKQLEQRLLVYQAKSAVLKLALDIVGELQQTILKSAFAVILEHAKPFTNGLLRFDLSYSPEHQELGYQSDVGWVSHKVFSDSEAALAYAGLSVALAQSSPFKVVFFDEMGKLEVNPVNRKKLVLERMCELVEKGVIHAFFGADNRTEDYLEFNNPNFKHVILG